MQYPFPCTTANTTPTRYSYMEENTNIEGHTPEDNIPEKLTVNGETTTAGQLQIEQSEIPTAVGTTNPTLQTEEMEVHKHPHHVTHKKKWGEYLLEFLMLFLAVFLGFLAENIREHQVEKEREHQFINSLVADLQDDGKNLDATTAYEKKGIRSLDTLMELLNSPQLAKQNGDVLYYVARLGPRSFPFSNNSRTFDQLKNSGGFRLIGKLETSNNIMDYYNQFALLHLLEDNYNHEFDDYKRVAAKILDPALLRRQEGDNAVILRSNDNPALRTYDPEALKELGFHTLQMNGSRRSKVLILENLKAKAAGLITYLKKNYRIE